MLTYKSNYYSITCSKKKKRFSSGDSNTILTLDFYHLLKKKAAYLLESIKFILFCRAYEDRN